jgi:RNA polymerase sigma-70 factor (ECF subfamily)
MGKKEFIELYDQYAPKIYRFVYLKVNSVQDSEDLTSEVFFKFWDNFIRNRDNKKKIDNPRAFLYRIANNLVTDFYRKKSRTELISDPKEDVILAKIKDSTDLNDQINAELDISEVKKALARLKGEYQNIIIWRYLDDFSNKEIAQIMEKPEGTVRVLVHRALKELKKQL